MLLFGEEGTACKPRDNVSDIGHIYAAKSPRIQEGEVEGEEDNAKRRERCVDFIAFSIFRPPHRSDPQ